MQKLISIIFLFGWVVVCQAQDSATLSVTISNLENPQGQLLVALFNNPEGFPEGGAAAFRSLKSGITVDSVTVSFRDLPPGIYAVCFVHDRNMNEEMDKRMGIPSEKYGVSNNIRMGFGPPKYEEAKFYLNRKDTTIYLTPAF